VRRLIVIEVGSRLKLSEVIDRLPSKDKIDFLRKATWIRLYRIKNGCFQEDREPNDKQRADLNGEILRLERVARFSISVIGWYVLPCRLIKKPSREAAGNEDPGAYAVGYVRSLSD
jgi:hypothetical protein